MTTDPAAYVRSSFDRHDRLAVVLVNKNAGRVVQRLATAERIASTEFQSWLRERNAQGYEIYVSMNALREDAGGRTKTDIAAIRHVFLDVDENGDQALRDLRQRSDLPAPSFVINTSPDKWQVIWKVEKFTKGDAEALQKGLARQTGADVAATDCARVLRLPGFYNHKYASPFLVRLEAPATPPAKRYGPQDFPRFARRERRDEILRVGPCIPRPPAAPSQSERDWAYAKRALARGDREQLVIAAIATFRRYDKHNPQYYAELTVRKASQALSAEQSPANVSASTPER